MKFCDDISNSNVGATLAVAPRAVALNPNTHTHCANTATKNANITAQGDREGRPPTVAKPAIGITALFVIFCTANDLAQTPFTDPRDGKTYKTVKIGEQTWMAENLNYNAEGSKCYENKSENCEKYGRLYNWETAMNACPSGWHLPSDEEYGVLEKAVGEKVAGKKLKAKSGWNDYKGKSGNGTDKFGFTALPGGDIISGRFGNVGDGGYWWTASEGDRHGAYSRLMSCKNNGLNWYDNHKSFLFSVRCIKDKPQGEPE